MNHDLFPSLDFRCLKNWAKRFVEYCFPGAGIGQFTLRAYNLWNKEAPELAKEVRLRSKSHPEFLVIIHLSEKYEHNSRRTELIRTVHGPTIWDEQNYLSLGINTSFLDCLKRSTISNLCEEMQRFAFWCYGAQKGGEYSPETNGYVWPLHADPKGDSWLLYSEASFNRKPQSPIPDRFSPSSSYSGNHTGDCMEFISEIRDIDDDAYVTMQELKVLGAKIDQLMLKYKNYEFSGYRFIFMGVEVVNPSEKIYEPFNFKFVTTVPMNIKTAFFRDHICKSKEMFYDEASKFWGSLSRVALIKRSETIGDYAFLLNRYDLQGYKERLKGGEDVFAIPAQLRHDDDVHDHELYFKKSDLETHGVLTEAETFKPEPSKDEEIPGTSINTIREIDIKTCMLTYKGIVSQVSGKGVFIIRQLLLSKYKEFPVAVFNDGGMGASKTESDDELEGDGLYEPRYEPHMGKPGDQKKIHIDVMKQYQAGVTELIETIEDLKERLKDADISKKPDIENELDKKQKAFQEVKKTLQEEHNAWTNDKGVVCYREKNKGEKAKVHKEYKKAIDGIRNLVKSTIGRVKDSELKNHLTNSIEYGSKLRYSPTEQVEWKTVK